MGTDVRSSRLLNMLAEADVTAPCSKNKIIIPKTCRKRVAAEGRVTKRFAGARVGHSFKQRALEIGSTISAVQALKEEEEEEEEDG